MDTKQQVVQSSGSGIGFGGLLAIVFITLKLCGIISWSWLWVLSPLWIPIALVLGFVLAVALFFGLCAVATFLVVWVAKFIELRRNRNRKAHGRY